MNVFYQINYDHQFEEKIIQDIYQDVKTETVSTLFPKKIKVVNKMIAKQSSKKKKKLKQKYNWTETQNRRYVRFLIKKGHIFSLSNQEKKKIKINKIMSNAIETRTPIQCHTHHQKMFQKFGSVEQIIVNFQHLTKTKLSNKIKQSQKDRIQIKRQSIEFDENQLIPKCQPEMDVFKFLNAQIFQHF